MPEEKITTIQSVCMEELKKNLKKLQELPIVPKVGSEEYHQDVEGYRAQRDAINDIHRDAEVVAMMMIPPEAKSLLDAIKERRQVLLQMDLGKDVQEEQKCH